MPMHSWRLVEIEGGELKDEGAMKNEGETQMGVQGRGGSPARLPRQVPLQCYLILVVSSKPLYNYGIRNAYGKWL